MKIAIFGTGGVGGYFGARLAAQGQDVHFIARGAHLAALRAQGLKVLSPLGDLHLPQVQCTDDPAAVGPADLVMVAVKLWSTDEAAEAARPLVGPDTTLVSFQNGVVAADILERVHGRERVMGGVASIAALIEAPGVIRHNGNMANLTFGEFDGSHSPRARRLLEACTAAGIDARVSDNILTSIWEKYVFLVGMSSLTTLTRLPIGPIREDAETRALLAAVMSEVIAVGRARGVTLSDDLLTRVLARVDSMPRGMVASMLGDLERGNRLELPWLAGGVQAMGRESGVATPASSFVVAALRPWAQGRPADARG